MSPPGFRPPRYRPQPRRTALERLNLRFPRFAGEALPGLRSELSGRDAMQAAWEEAVRIGGTGQ